MDKPGLPISYYLNNGEPDKTGYQQLALSAFYKAVSFHPGGNCVTLGPNADPQKKNSPKPQTSTNKNYDESLPIILGNSTSTPKSKRPISTLKNEGRVVPDDEPELVSFLAESPEQKEEKLLRKRILTSLENICLSESQAKLNSMRVEWMKRDEETLSRLQGELDATTNALQEKMDSELSERQLLLQKIQPQPSTPLMIDKPATPKPPQVTKPPTSAGESKASGPPPANNSLVKNLPSSINPPVSILDNSKLSHAVSSTPKVIPEEPRPGVLQKEDLFRIQRENQKVTPPPQAALSVESNVGKKNIERIPIGVSPKVERIVDPPKQHLISTQEPHVAPKTTTSISGPSKLKTDQKKPEPSENISSMEEDLVSLDQISSPPKAPDPETEMITIVMGHYKKYWKKFNEVKVAMKEFVNNESLKKFRSDCQKAVNVPVNAISGVSSAHLSDKLNKLTALLSGTPVMVVNKSFNPSQHPLGVTYCTYLLAEKIVKQGEDAVSVKFDSAFPIALVVLALWNKFPLFGELLIGKFHQVCPYLVPIYWLKEDGMSNEDYYRKLGFKYSGNERENIDMFLKRQSGVVRLYFSIVISQTRSERGPHPLPLSEAWRWLAVFTALEPSAEITATLLYDMLDFTGHSMLKTYKKQFLKVIHLICVHFVPKIEKVTPEGKGGPVARLKSFLEDLIRAQDLKPPKGILPQNFL